MKINERRGRSTCDFSIRQNRSTAVTFNRGEPVLIYNDALNETIKQSTGNCAGPWGLSGNALYASGSWAKLGRLNGTFEFIINERNFENDIFHQAGIWFVDYGPINAADWWLIRASMEYHGSPAVWSFRVGFNTYQAGVLAGNAYGNIAIKEDKSYRVSITWTYDVGPDQTTWEVFLDGTSMGSHVQAGTPASQTTNNDRIYLQGDYYHDSHISDIRLWDKVRTPAEIMSDMKRRLIGTETGLLLYWKLDEGSGTGIGDSSGNGRTGTVSGGNWTRSFHDWTGLLMDGYEFTTTSVNRRYFNGMVSRISRTIIGPNTVQDKIQCIDMTAVLDRRSVTGTYNGMTAKYIADKILQKGLSGESIGGGVVSMGPSINEIIFDTTPTAQALDQLADALGGWFWWIDFYGELHLEQTGPNAPFNIMTADSPQHFLDQSMLVSATKDKYANRLITRIKVVESGVEVGYKLVADNLDEQASRQAVEGGTGIYERIEDLPRVFSLEQGSAVLIGRLYKASKLGKSIDYQTDTDGLRVGQIQFIQEADFGLNGNFIIDSIGIELQQGSRMRFSVTATDMTDRNDLVSSLGDSFEEKTNFVPVSTIVQVMTYERSLSEGLTFTDTQTESHGTPECRLSYMQIGYGEIK